MVHGKNSSPSWLWSRFAITGDPNAGEASPWPPYDLAAESQIILDVPIMTADGVRGSECDFLESLP
jgi:hypothetical protein